MLREALLGALLTGLMVLVFLRDWRSSAIVVITIPFALLAAVVALWGAGQTINIMTLGGLALAVGILVDEATVAIENIHTHLSRGTPVARAVLDASGEVVVPRLLAMLSVVAVFVPSFFMTGVSRSLFVPLSLAVGFAMIASFFLSSALVPVLSVWWLRTGPSHRRRRTARGRTGSSACARGSRRCFIELAPVRGLLVVAYLVVTVGVVVTVGMTLGREIFPPSGVNAFQLRFRAPGRHEVRVDRAAGPRRPGRHPRHGRIRQRRHHARIRRRAALVVSDQHDLPVDRAVRTKACCRSRSSPMRRCSSTRFRRSSATPFIDKFPDAQFSFEPGDIVSRIMNFGAPTPVEVAVMGPDFAASRAFATKVRNELSQIGSLRDLQFGQTLDYPAIQVNVNRQMAGQLGVTVDQVGRSFAAATSSSRFVAPNYWADPRTGIAFQVQVEVPQPRMTTLEDLRVVPVSAGGVAKPLLGDLARIENATIVGEYDRVNGQRMVTLTANVAGEDLGRALDSRERGDPTRG